MTEWLKMIFNCKRKDIRHLTRIDHEAAIQQSNCTGLRDPDCCQLPQNIKKLSRQKKMQSESNVCLMDVKPILVKSEKCANRSGKVGILHTMLQTKHIPAWTRCRTVVNRMKVKQLQPLVTSECTSSHRNRTTGNRGT